jgi:hypothetical protein
MESFIEGTPSPWHVTWPIYGFAPPINIIYMQHPPSSYNPSASNIRTIAIDLQSGFNYNISIIWFFNESVTCVQIHCLRLRVAILISCVVTRCRFFISSLNISLWPLYFKARTTYLKLLLRFIDGILISWIY